jgi:hypothetical protein
MLSSILTNEQHFSIQNFKTLLPLYSLNKQKKQFSWFEKSILINFKQWRLFSTNVKILKILSYVELSRYRNRWKTYFLQTSNNVEILFIVSSFSLHMKLMLQFYRSQNMQKLYNECWWIKIENVFEFSKFLVFNQ